MNSPAAEPKPIRTPLPDPLPFGRGEGESSAGLWRTEVLGQGEATSRSLPFLNPTAVHPDPPAATARQRGESEGERGNHRQLSRESRFMGRGTNMMADECRSGFPM